MRVRLASLIMLIYLFSLGADGRDGTAQQGAGDDGAIRLKGGGEQAGQRDGRGE